MEPLRFEYRFEYHFLTKFNEFISIDFYDRIILKNKL